MTMISGVVPRLFCASAVVKQQSVEVLIGFLVVVTVFGQVVVDVERGVRLLLGEQLVQRLARLLLVGRRAELDPGRPPLRRDDSPVQGIVPGLTRFPRQGVSRLLYRVVPEVSGLMTALIWHPQLLPGG